MDALTLVLFVVGLVLLVGGAELLVRGASRLALSFGVSALVVGLTVVSIGTSAPELAIGIQAAFQGNEDITVGNVIGSNVYNVLLILGVGALIAPLICQSRLLKVELPIMVGVSLLVWGLAADGALTRSEGFFLLTLSFGFLWLLVHIERKDAKPKAERVERSAKVVAVNLAMVVAGLAGLVVGGRWLVNGAVQMAETLGVDPLVIGLTVVAIGTSLPEVATTVVAVLRGERDIAVGNVIGSNVLNLLLVLGATLAVVPGDVEVARSVITFDLPVMVGVAIACLPIFFTDFRVSRWEGAVFLVYAIAYTTYLVLNAQEHTALAGFERTLAFAIPITGVTLLGFAFSQLIKRRASRGTR